MDDKLFKAISINELNQYSIDLFSCGNDSLDSYFHKYAKINNKIGIGKTFVLIDQSEHVVGFYTVSMASIDFLHVPKNFQKSLPKYPVPVARIGRLAVDVTYQGKKFGSVLLLNALKRIYEASKAVAAYAVIVDAKDDRAKGFYEHHGFVSYKDEPLSLFLPISTVNELFEYR